MKLSLDEILAVLLVVMLFIAVVAVAYVTLEQYFSCRAAGYASSEYRGGTCYCYRVREDGLIEYVPLRDVRLR